MARGRRTIPVSPRAAALIALVASSAALSLGAAPAAAQPQDELAAARQVFGEGKALEGKGSWADALEKFKKVASVKMTPQVRFHIALCEENLGHLVSALKGFELATEEAKQAGAAATEVEKLAPPRADALRARVAKVRVEASGKVTTSKIVLDEVTLGAKDLGTDILVDPGSHVVEVRDKDGKSTFHKELTLAETGSEKVVADVDDRDAAPEIPGGPPASPPSRAPIFVAAGVGAAAFAVSAVFWVLRGNTISQAVIDGRCNADFTGCHPGPTFQSDLDQGHRDTLVSGVLVGVGAAGMATAATILIVQQVRKPSAAPRASVQILPMGPGMQLVGRF